MLDQVSFRLATSSGAGGMNSEGIRIPKEGGRGNMYNEIILLPLKNVNCQMSSLEDLLGYEESTEWLVEHNI